MAKKIIKKKTSTTPPQPERKLKFTRLGDVIDKTKNFNMLYSGVEDDKNFNILYDLGIRDFLMSYHYLQTKNINTDMYTSKGIKFLIDSGAFTYMNDEKYNERTVEEWEAHIHRYLDWARNHREIIFAIASLDLEYLVGGDIVQEWNEKYFEPFMLETGIPVCFVWHSDGSKLTWEQYCQRYPYVGVSWSTDDGSGGLKNGLKLLQTAEKYNTVVHGMAMTRTSLLTKLPFYTVDSTTWMVGVQYGEVNWWRGNKMSRLKKDKWKGEMLEEICSTLGRDRELLLAEDSSEMIKVNVQAFMLAEKFIQEKAKGKMYWLKPQLEAKSIEDVQFPPIEWLDSPDDTWVQYAKKFNISTDMKDPQQAIDLIIDATCILNWDNPYYKEFIDEVYTPELIKSLHDCWVNQVVASDVERVEDLVNFFKSCVEGKSDRLLLLGTNFDRIAKERDSYITEDTHENKELSREELIEEVKKLNLLPPPNAEGVAPEIDSLDDEIFADNGLITVRDEKGKFLKGQKKVKKPKNIYSDKYPKLVCGTCYASQNCPEFKDGHVCAFNKMFKRFDSRSTEDILEAMQGMVNMNMERMQRVAIFEMLDGGMPDGNLTMMIDQNFRLLSQMSNVARQNEMIRQTQTRVVSSDGTVTETTSTQAKPGILEKMFMQNLGKQSKEDDGTDLNDLPPVDPDKIVDVEVTSVEDDK